jgi:DNA-binding transcriptional LysR family regulator
MKILMSSNHPLAKKNAVTIDEISKESLILPAKGCDKDIQNVLKKTQQTIDIKYTLSDDISVMAMVEKGFGIGILPSLMLRNFSFDIVTKPFAPAEYRTIGLASLPNSQVSIVTKTFIEFLLANKELLAV